MLLSDYSGTIKGVDLALLSEGSFGDSELGEDRESVEELGGGLFLSLIHI